MRTDRDDLQGDTRVTVVGVLVVLAGAALATIRFLNSTAPEQRDVEAVTGTLMFGVAVATPGLLTLMARHDRPTLLLPAAVMLVPFSFLSFALVTLPLLVPAYWLAATYRHHRRPGRGWWDGIMASVLTLSSVGAVAALFANGSRRTYRTSTSVVETEIIDYAGAASSFGLVAATVALAWWATRPADG